jgi:chromosome segregation ATPase
MRTREKVIIILVGATLILGSLIFYTFRDNEVEANYFRWQLANKLSYVWSAPTQFIADELPSGTLFYGGLTIFAIAMTLVALKMVRDGEIQALRRRLLALRTEKTEAEGLLQEQVWRGKTERQAKDSVMRDLEASIEKIELLLSELNEKERELKTRDAELMALKTSPGADSGAASSLGAEQQLREELNKKNELLQAKDAALRDAEQRLGVKTRHWEAQLRDKDGLLKERASELRNFRAEITEITDRVHQLEGAKKRAEDRLEEELRQKKEVLEADALAIKAEEKRLGETIRALEAQLSERDKTLRQRDSEMGNIRRQLSELQAAKAQNESDLEKISAKTRKEQEERDRALREVKERLGVRLQQMQDELGKKDLLLQVRDDELKSLQSEVKAVSLRLSEMAAAKARVEEALQEDLKKERQQHEGGKAAYRQLEERYHTELKHLNTQLDEREVFLQRRDEEVHALEQQVHSAFQRLEEANTAKGQLEKSLREELKKQQTRLESGTAATREAEQRYGKEINALKSQVAKAEESRKNRDEENKSLKAQVASLAQQLAKVGSAKEHAAQLLQQTLKKEKAVLQASDSAVREIEDSFKARIEALEEQLAAKQNLVGSRDTEVSNLKSGLLSLQQKLTDLATAKEKAETLFEEAVRERAELLQSKDAGIKKLEADLSDKVWKLESRLREKEELLHRREAELEGFKNQLAELVASKEHVAHTLHDDLREKTELLGAKETALTALEARFNAAVRDLESELNQKQEILEARESELKALSSKLNSQAGQLAQLEQSRDGAARMLEDELRRATELLQSKEAAMRALDDRLTGKLRSLEGQLGQKQELLEARDAELDALMAKVSDLTQKLNESGAERERRDRLLQEELRETSAQLQSKESSLDELEERFGGRIDALERQVAEKQRLLESSGADLGDLRAQMNALHEQLSESETARAHLEDLLQSQRSKSDKALMVMRSSDQDGDERVNGEGRGVDTLLSEREELLKARDKLIHNLMTELKEKKTQLARQEIEVWKGIERREAWKHRLSKLGIRLKD